MRKFYAISLATLSVAATAGAQTFSPFTPASYSMQNGDNANISSTTAYLDNKYTGGTGDKNTAGSALAGGSGLLTDGATSTSVNPTSTTAAPFYVGWKSVDPSITFKFSSKMAIDQVDLYTHNAGSLVNGATILGPTAYKIEWSLDGTSWTTAVNRTGITYGSSGTQTLTSSNLHTLIDGANYVRLSLTRNTSTPSWVLLQEVKFTGLAVPEPTSLAVLGIGAAALLRRRKKSSK